MSDDIITRAEAALKGVTDGPWDAVQAACPGGGWWVELAHRSTVAVDIDAEDARFIAAARSIVPELVAELKTTRAQLAALQKPKPEKHPIGRCGDPSCGGDW